MQITSDAGQGRIPATKVRPRLWLGLGDGGAVQNTHRPIVIRLQLPAVVPEAPGEFTRDYPEHRERAPANILILSSGNLAQAADFLLQWGAIRNAEGTHQYDPWQRKP